MIWAKKHSKQSILVIILNKTNTYVRRGVGKIQRAVCRETTYWRYVLLRILRSRTKTIQLTNRWTSSGKKILTACATQPHPSKRRSGESPQHPLHEVLRLRTASFLLVGEGEILMFIEGIEVAAPFWLTVEAAAEACILLLFNQRPLWSDKKMKIFFLSLLSTTYVEVELLYYRRTTCITDDRERVMRHATYTADVSSRVITTYILPLDPHLSSVRSCYLLSLVDRDRGALISTSTRLGARRA